MVPPAIRPVRETRNPDRFIYLPAIFAKKTAQKPAFSEQDALK